jgi:hypothetical protein
MFHPKHCYLADWLHGLGLVLLVGWLGSHWVAG